MCPTPTGDVADAGLGQLGLQVLHGERRLAALVAPALALADLLLRHQLLGLMDDVDV